MKRRFTLRKNGQMTLHPITRVPTVSVYTVFFLSLTTGEDEFVGNFPTFACARVKATTKSQANEGTFAYVKKDKRIVFKVGR